MLLSKRKEFWNQYRYGTCVLQCTICFNTRISYWAPTKLDRNNFSIVYIHKQLSQMAHKLVGETVNRDEPPKLNNNKMTINQNHSVVWLPVAMLISSGKDTTEFWWYQNSSNISKWLRIYTLSISIHPSINIVPPHVAWRWRYAWCISISWMSIFGRAGVMLPRHLVAVIESQSIVLRNEDTHDKDASEIKCH